MTLNTILKYSASKKIASKSTRKNRNEKFFTLPLYSKCGSVCRYRGFIYR